MNDSTRSDILNYVLTRLCGPAQTDGNRRAPTHTDGNQTLHIIAYSPHHIPHLHSLVYSSSDTKPDAGPEGGADGGRDTGAEGGADGGNDDVQPAEEYVPAPSSSPSSANPGSRTRTNATSSPSRRSSRSKAFRGEDPEATRLPREVASPRASMMTTSMTSCSPLT